MRIARHLCGASLRPDEVRPFVLRAVDPRRHREEAQRAVRSRLDAGVVSVPAGRQDTPAAHIPGRPLAANTALRVVISFAEIGC